MKKSPYTFKCLETIDEVNECSKLVSNSFSKYDKFATRLGISKEELFHFIKDDLLAVKDDNLTIICIDKENKIIGCYAGFKFNKFQLMSNNDESSDNLHFKIARSLEDKFAIWIKIDSYLYKPIYDKHLKNDELNKTLLCDYFCVSEEYFQSSLSKELIISFFNNCYSRGIRHVYGSFNNAKAITLVTKYFSAKVIKEIKVTIEENEEKEEYKVSLLYGYLEQLLNKPNF